MDGQVTQPERWPLVSVIVRTHAGRRQLLLECLRSIDAQRYRRIEVVVVEDGSAEARPCIERFRDATTLAVQYHSIPKGGRCVAGNRGLEAATGLFLNFLDDDDQFYPMHVGLLAARLRDRPDLSAVYSMSLDVPTKIHTLDPLLYTEEPGQPFRGGAFSRARLWNQNFLPIQSVMFRKELFLRCGGFDLELDQLEDWNLWTRYLSDGKVEFIDEVTSFFRTPASSKEQLRRNAVIQHYVPLAAGKQRHVFVNLSVAEIVDIAREMQQMYVQPLPVPRAIRNWFQSGDIRRAIAAFGARYLRIAMRVARGLAARPR